MRWLILTWLLVAAPVRADAPQVISEELEAQPLRVLVEPSWGGTSGLFRLPTAELGVRGQVRLALRSELFAGQSFLVVGDKHDRTAARLVVGGNVLPWLETFAVVASTTNHNVRTPIDQETVADARLTTSVTDAMLGLKVATDVGAASIGLVTDLTLLGAPGGLSIDGSASTYSLTGILGVSAERLGSPLPLRLHVAIGQIVDNSRGIIDLTTKTPVARQIVTFHYRLRPSRFHLGLGIDAPVALGARMRLSPIVEYHLEVATGEAERAFTEDPTFRTAVDGRVGQTMVLGLRGHLTPSMSIDAGVEVGLGSPGFAFGPPLLPWNVLVGLAYTFDPLAPPERVVRTVRVVEKVAPPPAPVPPPIREGRLAGLVLRADTGAPLADAIVEVPGVGRLATGDDGRFRTPPLPVGVVHVSIRAPGFEPAAAEARIEAAQDTAAEVRLAPRVRTFALRGRLQGTSGPLAGRIDALPLAGSGGAATAATDAAGAFQLTLPSGRWLVRASADGHLYRARTVEIAEADPAPIELSVPRRGEPLVGVASGRLLLARPVPWQGKRPRLGKGATAILDEIADAVLAHPEWRRVRVQLRGSKTGDPIADARARIVLDELLRAGIPAERLEVRAALGPGKPGTVSVQVDAQP